MSYTLSRALPSDAAAIMAITTADVAHGDTAGDQLSRLMLGAVPLAAYNADAVPRLASELEAPDHHCLVMRDDATGEPVSFARWQFVAAGEDEQKHRAAEARDARDAPKPGMNARLLDAYHSRLDALRLDALEGRPAWVLRKLGTHPKHRGLGLASELVRWPFADVDAGAHADHEGTLVYLETNRLSPSRPLYERLGFIDVGRFTLDLSHYGGEGAHETVAMVRYPIEENV